MSSTIQAMLSNPQHPEYGQITVPFPIPREQYDQIIEMLQVLDLGFSVNRDCMVNEIDSRYSVLDALRGTLVNVDQLDYLAKRLDSFCPGETAQFQAMAHKLELAHIKDFINLTFCCQEVTVITSFSNLERIGREHYMNLNGGCAVSEELANLDGLETALLLIDSGAGVVTPYGVVYDNGMKLEPLYNGRQFPAYSYDNPVMALEITPKQGLTEGQNPEYLYFPASAHQIERTLLRVGITDLRDAQMCPDFDELPEYVSSALDMSCETPDTLNELCLAIGKLGDAEKEKLKAVMPLAGPENAGELSRLAENLDQFEFAPGVQSIEAYGRYMIRESGLLAYDENLDEYYDYRLYGEQHIHPENGQFNACGYVEYQGTMDLDELLRRNPAEQQEQGPQMGGLT